MRVSVLAMVTGLNTGRDVSAFLKVDMDMSPPSRLTSTPMDLIDTI